MTIGHFDFKQIDFVVMEKKWKSTESIEIIILRNFKNTFPKDAAWLKHQIDMMIFPWYFNCNTCILLILNNFSFVRFNFFVLICCLLLYVSFKQYFTNTWTLPMLVNINLFSAFTAFEHVRNFFSSSDYTYLSNGPWRSGASF